jgi:hypothetical protein
MTMRIREFWNGKNKGAGGGPKRTFKEMAEEFGVSVNSLRGIWSQHGGPKSDLNQHGPSGGTSWYDPKVVRAWWATVPEEVKHPKGKK